MRLVFSLPNKSSSVHMVTSGNRFSFLFVCQGETYITPQFHVCAAAPLLLASPPQVCGLAVLGKENIMRHAAEQHEGRGAYQCQYCKKVSICTSPLACMRVFLYRPARCLVLPSQRPPPPSTMMVTLKRLGCLRLSHHMAH